jgi:hypothetical protein
MIIFHFRRLYRKYLLAKALSSSGDGSCPDGYHTDGMNTNHVLNAEMNAASRDTKKWIAGYGSKTVEQLTYPKKT